MINSIKFTFVLTISITLFSILGCSQEQEKPKIASFTEDFEVGLSQWKIEECKGAAPALDKSKAKAGSSSLLLTDTVTLVSEAIKLPPRKSYEFRLDSFSEHIGRFWVRVEEYDRDNNLLTTGSVNKTSDGMWEAKRSKRNFWYTMHFPFDTSADCDHVKIRLRKWSKDKVWLDNIRIDNVESHLMLKAEPLFPGSQKHLTTYPWRCPALKG